MSTAFNEDCTPADPIQSAGYDIGEIALRLFSEMTVEGIPCTEITAAAFVLTQHIHISLRRHVGTLVQRNRHERQMSSIRAELAECIKEHAICLDKTPDDTLTLSRLTKRINHLRQHIQN